MRIFVGDDEECQEGDGVENFHGGVVAHPGDVARVWGVRVVIVVGLSVREVMMCCTLLTTDCENLKVDSYKTGVVR